MIIVGRGFGIFDYIARFLAWPNAGHCLIVRLDRLCTDGSWLWRRRVGFAADAVRTQRSALVAAPYRYASAVFFRPDIAHPLA